MWPTSSALPRRGAAAAPVPGVAVAGVAVPGVAVPGMAAAAVAGPATTTLQAVVAYLAAMLRWAGAAYIVVEVIIWHAFYTAPAWRLAAPALAVAWAVALTAYLRLRFPSPALACADFVFYAGLALGARAWVPGDVRYDAFSWVVIAMSGQLIVTAWFAPPLLALPLPLLSTLAYVAGVAPWDAGDGRTVMRGAAVLLIVGLVHSLGRTLLYRRAALADGGLDRADRTARERYAGLRRSIERREHERLVHDTVLNTLTGLSRDCGDETAALVDQCRRDVELITAALGGTGDLAADAPDGPADLPGAVRAIADGLRARGLVVHVEADEGAGAGLPARAAAALANAAREALSNVAAHAETGEAWVTVRQAPPLAAPEAPAGVPGTVCVTVRDEGAGFDPAATGPAGDGRVRLGLRRSITERVAECGGQAAIRSAPGRGTLVSLSWPAPGEQPR
jgi:signal transduction histidine kinase